MAVNSVGDNHNNAGSLDRHEGQDETDQNQLPFYKRKGFIPRFVLCFAAFLFLAINSVTNVAIVNAEIFCIQDKVINAIEGVNTYLRDNVTARNALLIIVALLLDISLFMLTYCWIVHGKTWRPVLTLFLFYLLKIICQNLFIYKYPENMIWEYPGFPSITVSYYKTKDFFFAGQIGLFLISAIELWSFGFKIFSVIAYIGILWNFFLMLALRGHYFIDLFSGLVAAHYFHMMSDHFHPYLNKIFSLESNKKEGDEVIVQNLNEDKSDKQEELNKTNTSQEILKI